MHTIFINYRRGDTAGEARALFTELAAILGKNRCSWMWTPSP